MDDLAMMFTPEQRAARVKPMFLEYERRHEGAQSEDQTTLVDFLADLRHMADELGLSFAGAYTSASVHYEAERSEPDG